MSIRPNAREWTIREQIIEDPVTGLTIQFETVPDDADSPYRLRIFGAGKFGNRELLFGPSGQRTGSGTFLGLCKPTWLNEER